jgi:DNA-binding NarL/FixJ family response regulator
MQKIKVLLADHMEIYREGLETVLKRVPGIEVVGQCRNGDEAIEKTIELQPDILLLAEGIPKADVLAVSERIRELKPKVHIIVFTQSRYAEQDPFQVFRSQASGYVDRETESGNLVSIMNRVMEGDFFVSPLQGKMLVQELNHMKIGDEENQRLGLSEREKEIISLVVKGLKNREIAGKLFISENTVKSHIARIMQKMQVKTRQQLAIAALERRVVARSGSG